MPESMFPAPGSRYLPIYLTAGETSFLIWLALTITIYLSLLAGSVTRFDLSATLPANKMAVLVVLDSANSSAVPQVMTLDQWAPFHKDHPEATLRLPETTEVVLSHEEFLVSYSVRATNNPAILEVTTKAKRKRHDAPFHYVQLRYRVDSGELVPLVMVDFSPFVIVSSVGLMALLLSWCCSFLLNHFLIRLPLKRERWLMRPPFNRDWFVARGVPFCFGSAPVSLDSLIAALKQIGARISVERGHGALRASLHSGAVLTINRIGDAGTGYLEALLTRGLRVDGLWMLVLVSFAMVLISGGVLIGWMLDPFSAPNWTSAWVFTMLAAIFASAIFIERLLRGSVMVEADKLGHVMIQAMTELGVHLVPLRHWPKLRGPSFLRGLLAMKGCSSPKKSLIWVVISRGVLAACLAAVPDPAMIYLLGVMSGIALVMAGIGKSTSACVRFVKAAIYGVAAIVVYIHVLDDQSQVDMLASKLEEYRRQHGVYPEQLDVMVPALLPALPKPGLKGFLYSRKADSSSYSLSYRRSLYNYCSYSPELKLKCHTY